MVRLATYDDIPVLIDGMLQLKEQTDWKKVKHAGYDKESLQQHWRAALGHQYTVVYVYERDGKVVGFCAATLTRHPLPPYLGIIHEWGWYGSRRAVAACWRAVCEWGKRRGATFAMRAVSKPTKRMNRVYEQLTWEVL